MLTRFEARRPEEGVELLRNDAISAARHIQLGPLGCRREVQKRLLRTDFI